MLTDDVMIDRRIIQEAETLIDQGHEVILLAAGQNDLPQFEWIGRVKVERIRQDVIPKKSGSLFVYVIARILKSCVSVVGPIREAFREVFRKAIRVVGSIREAFRKAFREAFRKAMRFVSTRIIFLIKVITLPVRIRLRSFRKGVLLPFESVIMDRIRRYDPDVIHAHDLPRLNVAVNASHRLHIPLIYDAHELYPEINTLSWSQKQTLFRLENKRIRHCDQVITVNPFIAEEMAKRYKIAEPLVIYNAVNRPNGFDPTDAPNRFRETMPIPDDVGILLYQGWMSPTRGLQDLVGAMEQAGNGICLVMMGYGDAREELEQIVCRRGLAGKVHF
ncbi:MAG: glycosyltransferase, partial [Phycisphaerae bacterium]|nr:glycosyltransferase [Phycisphaerae bacterium]